MNKSISGGLMLGAAMIITSLALYFISPTLFLSLKTWVILVVFIALLTKIGLDTRKANEGIMTFGDGFLSMFIGGAIAVLLCTIFEYIQFNFLDPGLMDLQKEIAIDSIEKLESFMGEDAVEAAMNEIEGKEFNTMGQTMLAFVMRLVCPVAVFSAIIALIIKKDNPAA